MPDWEVNLLPLEDQRWASFSTFFGSPEQVPQHVASWRNSIGTPEEELQWTALWEQILHQDTITDAAYAVVPYVLQELSRIEPRKRFGYLVVLASIECARQTDSGAPRLPEDLAEPYRTALASARQAAVELLSLEWPKIEFRYVLSILATFHDHAPLGDLLVNLDCLDGTCPRCGESVYPDQIQSSGYA